MTILEDAQEIVYGIIPGSRQLDYGDPKISLEKIAQLSSILTQKDLTGLDVVRVLKAVKLVRESYSHRRDNLVDECSYAHIESLLQGEEDENRD